MNKKRKNDLRSHATYSYTYCLKTQRRQEILLGLPLPYPSSSEPPKALPGPCKRPRPPSPPPGIQDRLGIMDMAVWRSVLLYTYIYNVFLPGFAMTLLLFRIVTTARLHGCTLDRGSCLGLHGCALDRAARKRRENSFCIQTTKLINVI